MLDLRASRVFLSGIALLLATPSVAAPLDELVTRTDKYKSEIKAAATLGDGLAALRRLKTYLNHDALSLFDRSDKEKNMVLRFSIHGLREYLSVVEDRDFIPSQCDHYKAQVIFEFSPKNPEPELIPIEAKDALDVIDYLCKK